MTSTFHGLETARRGMFTQQSALQVTGHNIANANTPGYSRQRVNFVQTEPYPPASMNRPQIPGQMGTGVKAGSIQRVRESFLDVQFRTEQNKLGYWESRSTALIKMEDIMNEPSENGLSAVLGEFWQGLQDLSTYPENEGTRQVVLQRGQAVVDTFHYLSDSLTTIKNDIGNELGVNLKDINSILKQIGDLNKQISDIEPHGYLPNDLYDQRDLLVDELSKHLNIKVEKKPVGGNALAVADGIYHIKMINGDGTETELVTGIDFKQIGFTGSDNKLAYDIPESIENITIFDAKGETAQGTISYSDNFPAGELKGLIESYGHGPTGSVKGIYPDMLKDIDKLAFSFASIFNEIHSKGLDLNGKKGTDQFFITTGSFEGTAQSIELGSLNPSDIAASTKGTENVSVDAGDGKNALNLANISSMLLSNTNQKLEGLTDEIDLTTLSEIQTGTLNSFYEGIIGRLGVDSMQANRLKNNSQVLSDSVNQNRQSVSSVSLDEEMTNLIQFQHAYNAAARQITVVDEMLDKIINGMGHVGR